MNHLNPKTQLTVDEHVNSELVDALVYIGLKLLLIKELKAASINCISSDPTSILTFGQIRFAVRYVASTWRKLETR